MVQLIQLIFKYNLSKYIKYVVKRTGLPVEFRNRVLGHLKSSHQPDALKLHLMEPNETDESIMRQRFVAMFKSKEDARAFVNDWNDIERRKAHIDQFIVRKNVVLVFLKNQMRPGIFADQLISFGFDPVFLFSLHETYRSIQNQVTKCKIRYKVMWIDDNVVTEMGESLKKSRKKNVSSDDDSSVSQKITKRKYKKRAKKIKKSRSRSQEKINLQENGSKSISKNKLQEEPNFKFRDLDVDEMYDYILKIGQNLTEQMDNIKGQIKGFFTLIQVANEAIEV